MGPRVLASPSAAAALCQWTSTNRDQSLNGEKKTSFDLPTEKSCKQNFVFPVKRVKKEKKSFCSPL
jgi:hypothetical protein